MLMKQKQVRELCLWPASSGGAAGNRIWYIFRADLRKHCFWWRESTWTYVRRRGATRKLLTASTP